MLPRNDFSPAQQKFADLYSNPPVSSIQRGILATVIVVMLFAVQMRTLPSHQHGLSVLQPSGYNGFTVQLECLYTTCCGYFNATVTMLLPAKIVVL